MIFTLTSPEIRGSQLADEIYNAVGIELDPVTDVLYRRPLEVEILTVDSDPGGQIQGVVSAHVPDMEYFTEDKEAAQADEARTNVKQAMTGLQDLSARDKAFALVGRAFAIADNAEQTVIDGIVDRATASAYITGKSEWTSMTADDRAWEADLLEAMALLMQAILVIT